MLVEIDLLKLRSSQIISMMEMFILVSYIWILVGERNGDDVSLINIYAVDVHGILFFLYNTCIMI